MQKALTLAKNILKSLEEDHTEDFKDINLDIFDGLFTLKRPIADTNRLIAFLIFAYDPDSKRMDIQKDRYENKQSIMLSVGCNIEDALFHEILSNSNQIFNDVVALYLAELTDWRWPMVYSMLDYSSNMLRFSNQKTQAEKKFVDVKLGKDGEPSKETTTTEFEITEIAKVNIQKDDILKRALGQREAADRLLSQMQKDFVATDNATVQDFGFSFTETAKRKRDVTSWRQFINERNERKKAI